MTRFAVFRMLAWLFVAVTVAVPATAHRSNESYVYFDVTDDALSGRFEVTYGDLDTLLNIDADGNGTVEEAEFLTAVPRIFEYLSKRLLLANDGQELTLAPSGVDSLDAGANGIFGQIKFDVEGLSSVPEELSIKYDPLMDINSNHFGFILIGSNSRIGLEENESYVSLTFSGSDSVKTLSLVGEPWLNVFLDFVEHGIWHIWLGFDHVLFLITLLLASVMGAKGSRWEPLEDFSAGFWNVAKIVTVFTISHSITLSLAAFKVLTLPSGLVEAVIAASIIAVALMNMFPPMHRWILTIVFVFGLFHGFGFANVLAPLALDPTRQAIGILAFNLGVEIGQLAIVAIAFPVLWVLRRWSFYPFMAFRLGTACLVLIAGMWLLERTTSYEINVRGIVHSVRGVQL